METTTDDTVTERQTQDAQESSETTDNVETGSDCNHNNEDSEQRNEDDSNNNNEDDDDDDGQDFFAMMYGQDEDIDNDENESDHDVRDSNQDVNVESNASADVNKISGKRRSDENDNINSKRIKAEPKDAPKKPDEKRLTTTIEAVEVDEPTAPPIPRNSFEFMSFLLDLNANNLEGIEPDLNRFSMSLNLRDISHAMSSDNLVEFRETFIPYILCDLWLKLKRIYNNKDHKYVNVANSKRFLSILNKFKTQKMRNGLEMKCISIVRQKESPVFRFGQLITIQTAVQAKPNSSKHMFTRRKYFGYITSHGIRNTTTENQSEVNLLRLLNEHKKDAIYIEEISFMTKYSDELYLRNDTLLAAEPISCVHNHYMEARAIFKFDTYPLCRQVFTPTFSTKPSGLSVVVRERKFDEHQVNMIQIALDVVASPHGSAFFAINGPKESERTTVLSEIVRQLVVCPHLREKKVLFCSSDSTTLKTVEKYLKSRKIMTYTVSNGFNDSLKDFAIKHVEHKLEKETDDHNKEVYEDVLGNLETGSELPVESAVLKYSSIAEKSRIEAMKLCPVIMGRIDDLCNDIMFYKYFTSKPLFNCCVIDDSTLIPEPQFYSLFMFHIEKFIFGGDISQSNTDQSDMFYENGLSRSFFDRYYRLHNQNDFQYQTTVFDI